MRKKDAEPRIAPAKRQLIKAFPKLTDLIERTPVYLVSKINMVERRNQIADELEADWKSSLSDTAAETIAGNRGYAVILYYEHISERNFEHYLFHEFGHVISINASRMLFDETRSDSASDDDHPLRSGAALWSEFIAEAIAYTAEDGKPNGDIFAINRKLEQLVDEAVNRGYLEPYPLAFYMAMMFADPTIDAYLQTHRDTALGLNNCDDDIVPYFEKKLLVLGDQLAKEEYYAIDKPTLTELGNRVNELWCYCIDQQNFRTMKAALKRLTH